MGLIPRIVREMSANLVKLSYFRQHKEAHMRTARAPKTNETLLRSSRHNSTASSAKPLFIGSIPIAASNPINKTMEIVPVSTVLSATLLSLCARWIHRVAILADDAIV
jgi:hypothetical protein